MPLFFIIIVIVILIQIYTAHSKYKKIGIQILPVFINQRNVLERYFPYFRDLPEPDKREFLRRVRSIIGYKLFVAKEGFMVNYSMKTLISGALVQLTFGMRNYLLPNYNVINIYPEAYLNHRTNKLYRGETNTLGYVSLSWKHFMDGYRIPNDRYNVGLHEMAHALLNTIIFSELHDENLDNKLVMLDKIPVGEKVRIFEGNHPFFRDYAKTNIKEFFAVAIECYFETPQEFNDQFPDFYKLMCNLLNQDLVKKQFTGCVEHIKTIVP